MCKKAKKAWECLNEIDILKAINKFDLAWSPRNIDSVVDTLSHYAPIEVLDREFQDDCIDIVTDTQCIYINLYYCNCIRIDST